MLLLPPHRYKKNNPGMTGRGNGGNSRTRNVTRGGATATRSTAAVIAGNAMAKQQCTKCRDAGRFGKEYMNHKGVCPHAVDSSKFTMAAIVISDDDDDVIPDDDDDDDDIDLIHADDGANGEPFKVVAAPPRRGERKRKLAAVPDGIASSSTATAHDGIASSSTATAHDGIASSHPVPSLVCVPCQRRFRAPGALARHEQRDHARCK